MRTKNFKIVCAAAIALVLILAVVLGIVFGVKGCKTGPIIDGVIDDPYSEFNELTTTTIQDSHKNKTQVGYSGQIVGSVERNKPVEGTHDEGFSKGSYPKYGSTQSLTTEQKTELIAENRKLTANGTWVDSSKRTSGTYDKMDKDGYLYKLDGSKPNAGVPERLYKHTGSVGLYGGNVADDEPAVVKNLTFRMRSYGNYYNVTGLYAPAGEVIKIQLSDKDMNATSGLTIHIGQALYNGQANNIWEQRGVNRMPIILNTMNITKETATYDENTGLWTGYVGSFLGGPIYVRSESATFSVTISGGVNYPHFILGVTTEEEYAAYCKSSAPYFDLEVWDRGVLHSGPFRKVKNYSYESLYKAAVLWEKIALVTTSVSNQGVVFLYDPFVAAGAAVAFPGRRSVNCPEGWITGSLNYNSFVTSGSWGNLHEYHHNFQGYGMGSGADGEVTNNGLNLVAYSLFTKISSARQIGSFGGAGMSGWNQYTSASWALNRVNNGTIGSTNGLAVYATLLHNFGQDAYTRTRSGKGSTYLDNWAKFTHQDMTYFASTVRSYGFQSGGNYSPSAAVKNANYPLFVPVSSVYQTGRTYNYDSIRREINTMQPYVIPFGKAFTVDLNPYVAESGQYRSGSVVIGNGFYYKIKSVNADGINGTFKATDQEGIYTFTPNDELRSGKIYVTLEIYNSNDDSRVYNGHELQDVDLVLEFQQSHESNKSVLERTIYSYSEDNMYADVCEAFDNNFVGYETTKTIDHSNPTQNANTDIWFWPNTTGHETYVESHPEYFAANNAIHVIDGKLYFPEDGKYRVYLRGRFNCAVYYSLDGKNYTKGAFINDSSDSSGFRLNDPNTYFDVEFDENNVYFNSSTEPAMTDYSGDRWLYVKELLKAQTSPRASYIGLGSAQWTMPMYTAEVKYYFMIEGTKTYVTEELTDSGTRYYYDLAGTRHYVERDGSRYYFDRYEERIIEGSVGSVAAETTYRDKDGITVSEEVANNAAYTPPTAASYASAYRRSYEFQKEFTSDYFYVRDYSYSYVGDPEEYSTWDEGVSIVSNNKSPWDNTTKIDNLLVEGQTTYFHSARNASAGAGPMALTLDMGKQITANSITFLGRTDKAQSNAQQGLPKNFKLEISDDGENFGDAGEYTNSSGAVYAATVALNKNITFRYIRITINSTHSNNSHFILSGIRFTYAFKLTGNGSNHISPDDTRFTYRGTWKAAQTYSSFGHVFLGSEGAEAEFEFDASEGGRFAILCSDKYEQNYEVYIDGVKTDSITVKSDTAEFAIRYISPALTLGKHKVVIKCLGESNIDSIALY